MELTSKYNAMEFLYRLSVPTKTFVIHRIGPKINMKIKETSIHIRHKGQSEGIKKLMTKREKEHYSSLVYTDDEMGMYLGVRGYKNESTGILYDGCYDILFIEISCIPNEVYINRLYETNYELYLPDRTRERWRSHTKKGMIKVIRNSIYQEISELLTGR